MIASNIDREKTAFLALANRGKGLTPIEYIYSNTISCKELSAHTFRSAYADIRSINSIEIKNINIETKDFAEIANIKIYQDNIKTIDDGGSLNLSIGAGDGDITIETYDSGASNVSKGSIKLVTYGLGDINLTPTLSGPEEEGQKIGNVFVNTLQFSVDPTSGDNTVLAPAILNNDTQEIISNITISSANGGNDNLSTGDINIFTYGTGNINLTPNLQGPDDKKQIGSVNINTLKFQVDPATNKNNILGVADGFIAISTFDSSAESMPTGNIDITTYGKGGINLTTTKSTYQSETERGDVNINSSNSTIIVDNDLTITAQKNINITGTESIALMTPGAINIGNEENTNCIGDLQIVKNTVTTKDSDYIEFDKPVYLSSGSNSVTFLPSGSGNYTYYWPEPSELETGSETSKQLQKSVSNYRYTWPAPPGSTLLDFYCFLLQCDSEGNLSWDRRAKTTYNFELSYDLEYISFQGGSFVVNSVEIPSSWEIEVEDPEEVVIENYLTSDSSGVISVEDEFVVLIQGLIPPPPAKEKSEQRQSKVKTPITKIGSNITINKKLLTIPPLPDFKTGNKK